MRNYRRFITSWGDREISPWTPKQWLTIIALIALMYALSFLFSQ